MRVIFSSEGGSVTVENDTIENIDALVRLVGSTLNVAPTAQFFRNGEAAAADTPLADGDEVSATKPAGQKG